ncbi:MAG TPA: cupin domain-containing protein [Acetobacteraceae bacterium]|nr:cupin domain-containing protein [Acetobacteraceae bacterium]
MTETASVRSFSDGFRWQGVASQPYKEDGSAPFRAISRQVLFADPALGCELRYFEVEPGGHSTLERHEHVHAVMILRGRGRCLVGNRVQTVQPFDLVSIPSWTWHQFRTAGHEALGFLCMVNAARDRPQLPNEQDLAALRADPKIGAFLG